MGSSWREWQERTEDGRTRANHDREASATEKEYKLKTCILLYEFTTSQGSKLLMYVITLNLLKNVFKIRRIPFQEVWVDSYFDNDSLCIQKIT